MELRTFKVFRALFVAFLCCSESYGGIPVWTFTPSESYPPTVSVAANGIATIIYTVTNQSQKAHRLEMTPIAGITPSVSGCASSCSSSTNTLCLPTRGSSCTLTLTVNGRDLGGDVTTGPELCEAGSTLQCYTPQNPLDIRLTSALDANLTITPATLALSVPGLTPATGGLVTTGTARVFTVHNTGPGTAMGITCPPLASPSISSIQCTGCASIQNGGTCTITVTPSSTASASVGNSTPQPVILSIQGTNTNQLNPTVNVLTYGSFYQAGWLFSIIETANTLQSIGGTVAAESDNVAPSPGTEYSAGGANTNFHMYSGTDGVSNTSEMVREYGSSSNYSAGYCHNYNGGSYIDWYLPAICQMGFGGTDTNFDCGVTPGSIPNMQYNLLVTNTTQSFNFVNNGIYWSSTASEDNAPGHAWFQQFAVGGGDGFQSYYAVYLAFGVRCVRAIT